MDSHVARSDAPDPTGSASPHTPVDILELLPDAVFVVAQGAADGRILYANLQASRMFGYERGALIGQPIELLVGVSLISVPRVSVETGRFFRAPRAPAP